jgi:hypothetical protein
MRPVSGSDFGLWTPGVCFSLPSAGEKLKAESLKQLMTIGSLKTKSLNSKIKSAQKISVALTTCPSTLSFQL